LSYLFLRVGVSIGAITTAVSEIKFKLPFVKELNDIFRNDKIVDNQKNNKPKIDLLSINNISTNNLIVNEYQLNKKIKDINFKTGETLIIRGNSGSGKSTFLLTLIGINKKYEGKIFYNDINIQDFDIKNLYYKISYCSSEPYLISGSIKENLFYGLGEKNKYINIDHIKKVLQICNCDFLLDKENFLDLNVLDEGKNFSSGQKQKISIVRSLLKNPDLLLLDEAMSNIDLSNEEEIFNNIRKNYRNLIIIIISHRKNLEKYSKINLNMDED